MNENQPATTERYAEEYGQRFFVDYTVYYYSATGFFL